MTNFNDTRVWKPWGIGTNSSHVWGMSTNYSHSRKSRTCSSQVWRILTNSSHVRNYCNSKTLEFPSTFIKLWYACEELERMQNAAALGGILSMWWICMIATWNLNTCVFLSHVRNIGMKFVTYLYQFFTRCEELAPIFQGVKFTKCEIYGSTQPRLFTLYFFSTSPFNYYL